MDKEGFEKKLRTQLKRWEEEIAKLRSQADTMDEDAGFQFQKYLEELEFLQRAARGKLTELQASSEDAWEDLKEGIINAWKLLDEEIQTALSRFKK